MADVLSRGRHSRALVLVLTALTGVTTVATTAQAQFSWTERQPAGATDKSWYAAAVSSDGAVWLAGVFGGRLYTSTDGGANWTERQPAGAADKDWICADASSDGSKLVVAANGGRMYTSADSGASWTERQPGGATDLDWTGVEMSADGTKLIACVWNGRLYTSSDSGVSWTERQPAGASSKVWEDVAVSADGTTMMAGIQNGRLYISTDSGVNWSESRPMGDTDAFWRTMSCSSDGTKMIVGHYTGRLYTSTDTGSNWTERQPAGAADKYWTTTASSADGTKLLAAVYTGGLYFSSDSGATWSSEQPGGLSNASWRRVSITGDGTEAIAGVRDSRLYTGAPPSVPTITTTAISNIDTGTADSGGDVTSDGGSSVTARGVCWSTSSNPTTADSKTTNGTGTGSFTSNITGLSPDTTYHVRAYATNSEGTGYGSDVSFRTSISVTTTSGNAGFIIGGSAVAVDPTIAVVAGNITNFKVSITANFKTGDALSYTGSLPGGVGASYQTGAGVLTFTGTASAADWQTLLRTVTFTTGSSDLSTRTVAFTAGGAIPYGGNGHFYEFVAGTTTWTAAKSAAEGRTLFGLQGYLATITSQSENDFIRQKLGADAWIGGSDASVEGEWRWISGPESGTLFSNGATPAGGQFANWNTGEPNNSGSNEHAAEIYSTDGVGKWNDLPESHTLTGYVAEYGGMPGDASPRITDTRDVTVSALPTVTTTSIASITSTAAASGGNIASDGGASVTARGVCWSTSSNPTTADSKTTDGTGTGTFASAITGLSAGTTYHVRAYATNSVGTGYGSDLTFTTDSVPTVTSTAASNITGAAADTGGNVASDNGDTVTARGVCWSTSADPTTADNITTDGTGTGVFTSSITGLSPDTTYHLRAYATNAVGTGYGSDLTFTTDAVPTITTTAVTAITMDAATSGGNVTADGGDTVTARGVCWSTSANPTIANDKTTDGSGTGSFASSLTGLTSATTYHVRAYATNAVGTGYGPDVSFTTDTVPTVVTGAVTNVVVTSATASGEVTSDGGDTVTTRGVCWSTSANPTTADNTVPSGSGTGSFTSDIAGLSAGTTYHVRAYATNSVGTGYGSDVAFNSSATAPTVVSGIFSVVGSTTATGGGEVTADGGATVTARGVCWSTSVWPTVSHFKTTDGDGLGSFTSQISGLNPNVTYYARAYASNSADVGYGEVVSFTTPMAAPVVTTAEVTGVTDVSAVCGGSIVADGGSAVVARGVCWNTTGSPTPDDNSTTNGGGIGRFTSEITDLESETAYYVRAYALSAIGTSYGEEQTFTTSAAPTSTGSTGNEQVAPDLRVAITAPAQPANVGEELAFEVDVQNVGNGDATGVVLWFPLPPGTEFIGAWLIAGQSAQAAPLDAYVDGDQIAVELDSVQAAADLKIEIVLRVVTSGDVTLEASVSSTEQPAPATAEADASVNVEDEYWEVVNTVTPIGACGMFGLVTPLLLTFGLLAMKRHHHRL